MYAGKYSYLVILMLTVVFTTPIPAMAQPGTILFSDNFEGGFGQWTAAGAGNASIGTETSNSGASSMRLRWNTVTATSITVNANVPAAEFSVWIRAGDDAFSEDPDIGGTEDLMLEYLNSSATWVTLEVFPAGTPGAIFNRLYPLPGDALHAGLQIRFTLPGGSGVDWDYWHVDDTVITERAPPTPPTANALGNWYFDEGVWSGSPNEIVDSSGNNRHGVANNATTTPGILCNAADLSANSNNDYLSLGSQALNGASNFTLSIWGRVSANGGYMTIVSGASGNSGLQANELIMLFDTPTGFIPDITVNFFNDTPTITTATIDDGQWHHFAWTRVAASRQSCFYLDGVLQGCVTNPDANDSNPLTIVPGGLIIGQDQDVVGGGFDAAQDWQGLLDEFLILDTALNATDIQTVRNYYLTGRNWDGTTRTCSSTVYHMDEAAWVGAGAVLDSGTLGNNGSPIGTVSTSSSNPAIAGNPGTCGYGNFPNNTSDTVFDAVNSTTTPGNRGAVTFWYNSNAPWNGGGDRMLLDASQDLGNNNADKYFFLMLRSNGRLRFRLEDSGDNDTLAETGTFNFAANTWVHIGITWDLPNDRIEVYINGVLSATSNSNLNGNMGTSNSLYIGDNRSNGIGGGGYTGNSANGLIDEARIYTYPLTQSAIANDMNATHSCSSIDHFNIIHDTTAINCQQEPVTIIAHRSSHSVDTTYLGTITLNTSTNRGDWFLLVGSGVFNNGAVNDGAATYSFAAADSGQVQLALKDTFVETVSINVADGAITEVSGSAQASEDQNLTFAQSGFNFLANGTAGNIGLQIAGKNSNIAPGTQTLELQAIRTSDSTGACEAALTGANNIALAFECENPTLCSARQVSINGTNIAGNNSGPIAAYTNVSLDFGNASDSTATFVFNYPDSGQIQLHARYNIPLSSGAPSGNFMLGASNSFVVRPFAFDVSVSGNPAASSAAGFPFTPAGSNFQVNARAVLWEAADDSNNDGIADGHNDNNPANNANLSNNSAALNYGRETPVESLRLSALLNQPGGGNDPGLSGGTLISTFASGSGNSSTVQYAEVGIIEIAAAVNDNNYLGIGGASTANITGKSGYVGRFIPSHFALTGGVISNRVAMSCAPPSSFTYMGENFRLEFTLTAQNTSSATTQNYTGAFTKLNPAVPGSFNIGAIDTSAPTPLSARIAPISSSGAWVNGTANIFPIVALSRAATSDGPYQNLAVGIDPIDSDNVSLASYDLDVDDNGSNDHGLVGNTDIRFGRMRVESISGSELIGLMLPLYTEYFANTQYIRNTDDSCSTYNAVDISFSNRQGLSVDPTTSGNGTLLNGNFDALNSITLNSNTEVGSIDATLAVPAWLQFDWDNNGSYDNDPLGHITFGIYSGSERQIYTREIY